MTDFKHGELLDFMGESDTHKLKDLTITQTGGNAVIADKVGDTVTLKGVAAASLSEKDFVFAPKGAHLAFATHDLVAPYGTGLVHDLTAHMALA